jgi:Zn-dependent peptidase ImmA (M78 family)
VNIERIIDVQMGIDIIREPDLEKRIAVEAFLSRDRSTIYVDDYTQDWLGNRYRFTLAHEIGHFELHKALYDTATFRTPEEWREFQQRIDPRLKARYEHQANCFAGLVLTPAELLIAALNEASHVVRGRWYEIDLDDEADRSFVIPHVARRLKVSGDVIERRGKFDGLWR